MQGGVSRLMDVCELVLFNLLKTRQKMKRILVLECMVHGHTLVEINEAIERLISEGRIYVCRSEDYIQKT